MPPDDSPPRARPFSKCSYSAFISFATLDDSGWNSWVSCFNDELLEALPGHLRGMKLLPSHFSGDKPLVAGRLSTQLHQRINESFAMFLFVHDNYNRSAWCLKELEYFKSMFGNDGFVDRLYVIAMSKDAIDALTSGADWKRLCPFEDQVWLPFFREDDETVPIGIYASQLRKRKVVANDFWNPFTEVLRDLAKKIRASVDDEPRAPSFPTVSTDRSSPLPVDELLVRVYIEANPAQGRYSESLGLEIAASWDRIVAAMGIDPMLYLRPTGLPMTEIDERPLLNDADGVVLLWSKKTPDAVAAQIKKVEPKLTGPTPAPGLIAYVMEGPDDQPTGAAIGNWNVVRFLAGADEVVRVVPNDAALLESFLRGVLARKRA